MYDRGDFGDNLGRVRAQNGLSQAQIARLAKVSLSSYSAWEQGKSFPRAQELDKLATVLAVTVDQLLGRKEIAQTKYTERGVTWHLGWAPPAKELEKLEKAANAFQRLLHGDRTVDVADSPSALEHSLQNLILYEQVQIEKVERDASLENQVRAYFEQNSESLRSRLREVRVIQLSHIDSKFIQHVIMGHAAKDLFKEKVGEGDYVGVCGGVTSSMFVRAVRRMDCPAGVHFVSVAVSPFLEQPGVDSNHLVAELAYRTFGRAVQTHQLPFYPSESLQPSATDITTDVREDGQRVDFLFLGAGAPGWATVGLELERARQDRLWRVGIDANMLRDYQTRSAGNLLYYLVDDMGNLPEEVARLNEALVCSITLPGLQRLVDRGKWVVLLAVGSHKARIVRAAIRAGYVNVLVICDGLAEKLTHTPM